MSEPTSRKIGLLLGADSSWADAFAETVREQAPHIEVELVKLGGTAYDDVEGFDVIIDRKSHDIPYFRGFLKVAALKGISVINNPFVTAVDDKFLGIALAAKLGISTPRTVLLPNKRVDIATRPGDFRNLAYPMDWQGIIDYVGVPAILKDALTGGRRVASRVSNVDDLINRYDESDTLNVILQQLVLADYHVHCFVVGQESVRPIAWSRDEERYLSSDHLPGADLLARLAEGARHLCRAYGYDINMVEFIVSEGQPLLINPTNPAPHMTPELLPAEDFHWCVTQIADLAIRHAENRLVPRTPFANVDS